MDEKEKDLVKRLRHPWCFNACNAERRFAADRIEQLEGELAKFKSGETVWNDLARAYSARDSARIEQLEAALKAIHSWWALAPLPTRNLEQSND